MTAEGQKFPQSASHDHPEASSSKDDDPSQTQEKWKSENARDSAVRFDTAGIGSQPNGGAPAVHKQPNPADEQSSPADQQPTSHDRSSGPQSPVSRTSKETVRSRALSGGVDGTGISEWSHQLLAPQEEVKEEKDPLGAWQEMPSYAEWDMFDDYGRLIAKQQPDEVEEAPQTGIGGAGKGYSKVDVDEDAKSTTSMDENTAYLFKEPGTNALDDDEEGRDPLQQMQATKDLLNENQKIAYVGLVRLAMSEMLKFLESIEKTRGNRKQLELTLEAFMMWTQKMMLRLYGHMDLDSAEQVMIEQLAEHGLQPDDLTPSLMENARVKNPMQEEVLKEDSEPTEEVSKTVPSTQNVERRSSSSSDRPPSRSADEEPPAYEDHHDPAVQLPDDLPTTEKIDIDLRWTVLCDLFLVLIADSMYDARSRTLLERVGSFLKIDAIEICRFEKRITDTLEMQEAKEKEKWNEDEHIETRRKLAKRRRMMMMGLATAGGTLIIGLSGGALGPVIGAGLAAGFTTIGVSGTGAFLGGAASAAIIGTGSAAAGGFMGAKASHRRTGAVSTFEYRPLYNNKRVNLIVTIAGWLNGKVDDPRLPFSTVDPVMGDVYSLWWEPEMLTSTGQTLTILATEALTQALQQVLAATLLTPLMAALQLPIVLSKLTYLVDNPWSVSLARADRAGLILADSLVDRNLGARPITLVGFSIGSRVIFAAMLELAKRGAVGLIQNVYLFGSPMVAKKDEYLKARTVVSGRFVNAYATNDWILGYLFRATSGGVMRVAGLKSVDFSGIENIDVSKYVNGHMAYRTQMPKLLRELGWAVTADEFTEIEDPDPDNHEARQRQLINEIEEARKELEQKQDKKGWGWFKRKKAAEKKPWEIYDDRSQKGAEGEPGELKGDPDGVLFDVEAIKKEAVELAAQGMEVKQLESTLPALKIDNAKQENGSALRPMDNLRATKSDLVLPVTGTSAEATRAKSFDYDYDEFDTKGQEEVTMTFDSEQPSTTGAENDVTPLESHEFSSSSSQSDNPQNKKALDAAVEYSQKNVWDDDDDFKEQEVEMTFA